MFAFWPCTYNWERMHSKGCSVNRTCVYS